MYGVNCTDALFKAKHMSKADQTQDIKTVFQYSLDLPNSDSKTVVPAWICRVCT